MHINLSEPAGFDLWKNLADQTSFAFMEHNEESMQMIPRDCNQIGASAPFAKYKRLSADLAAAGRSPRLLLLSLMSHPA